MADATPAGNGFQLRSVVPGRGRWEAAALQRRPQLVTALEQSLATRPGVVVARGNPVTGRLLVQFEVSLSSAQVAAWIEEAWFVVSSRVEAGGGAAPAAPAEGEPDRTGARAVAAAGGALLAVPLLVSAAAFAPPWLVVIGTVAAAGATAGWLRARARQDGLAGLLPVTSPLAKLARFSRPHQRTIYLASVCSLLNKVFDLAPPVLIGVGITIVTSQGSPALAALGIVGPMAQIWFLGAVTVVIWVLESAFEYAYMRLWRNLAQDVQHELRLAAYDHLQRLDSRFLENESTGRLAATLNDNINQIEVFVNSGANDFLQLAGNVIVSSVIFAFVAPEVAWLALVPVPFILWETFAYKRRIAPLYVRAEEWSTRVSGQLVNNISGLSTIRSFSAESFERARIAGLSRGYVAANREVIDVFSRFNPTVRMMILAGFTGTIVLGGALVIAGRMNPGVYALMLFLNQRFMWPFAYLGGTIDNYQKAMAAVSRVFTLLEAPLGPEGGDVSLPTRQVRGEIVFDRVRFGYEERRPVLRDFTLRLPPGRTTAIVGSTGVGKTSVVKLILRFYDVDAGRILLDGNDVRALRLRDLRDAIGLVSQDVFLFDGTVRDNIAYARLDVPLAAVIEAARLAEAHGFISELPAQYDTLIGERGMKLSGGQRQRLCIARALLKDPPILILDEATSSVDNETEAAIQRSLERISVGRTTVVIAHRLSTVRNADCIYVLGGDGRITEQGRHEELLALGGLYAFLWQVQTGTAVRGEE